MINLCIGTTASASTRQTHIGQEVDISIVANPMLRFKRDNVR